MNKLTFKHTKYTCYFTYLAMSSVFVLPPLLFATFRELYNISYTLLGTLIVVNFCTQLAVDLVFSFFNKHFNIHKTIRLTPLLTAIGLCVYATFPMIFPQHAYIGLVIGTFLFSVAAGLGEVLLSPTVAALPSDNHDSDLSNLHSLYGYGVVGVVTISTLALKFIGRENWMYLAYFWASLPVIASVLLFLSPLPDMSMESHKNSATASKTRHKIIILCMICIFLGSCTENTMCNWVSVYLENALHMPKVWGDIFGMCMFAALLALTRTVYAKYRKNIMRTLQLSMFASIIFYLIAGLSKSATVSLMACAALGISTSMLWPGTLILMEEKLPAAGVTAYALMAAGGDLGASVCPQLVGILIDELSAAQFIHNLGATLSMTPEQLSFKAAMIMTAIFPALGLMLLLYMKRFFVKSKI